MIEFQALYEKVLLALVRGMPDGDPEHLARRAQQIADAACVVLNEVEAKHTDGSLSAEIVVDNVPADTTTEEIIDNLEAAIGVERRRDDLEAAIGVERRRDESYRARRPSVDELGPDPQKMREWASENLPDVFGRPPRLGRIRGPEFETSTNAVTLGYTAPYDPGSRPADQRNIDLTWLANLHMRADNTQPHEWGTRGDLNDVRALAWMARGVDLEPFVGDPPVIEMSARQHIMNLCAQTAARLEEIWD